MLSGPHVFVIEDDEEIRESLLEILDEHGYTASGATNGREALELLERAEARPALILLDLMMPVMDGRTFRQAQLASPELAAIPVILFSAFGAPTDEIRALMPDAYLSKPLELNELLRLVRAYCPPNA